MKNTTLICLLLAVAASPAQAEGGAINEPCLKGGQKNTAFEWNVATGDLSYTATFNNCKPNEWASVWNGTISGTGTLRIVGSSFDTNVTYTEDLTTSGQDSGRIACTTTIVGMLDTTGSGKFDGTVTKRNCSYNVRALDVNIVDVLTATTWQFD